MAMRKRTQGRELALQTLYQIDLIKSFSTAERDAFLATNAEGDDQRTFATSLVMGVLAHKAEIDEEIEEVAKNWELDRMAIVDRNILRMGVLELCYRGDEIPPKVAINEGVDLAKKYSTKNSSGFVNGILDKVRERHVARTGGDAGKTAAGKVGGASTAAAKTSDASGAASGAGAGAASGSAAGSASGVAAASGTGAGPSAGAGT